MKLECVQTTWLFAASIYCLVTEPSLMLHERTQRTQQQLGLVQQNEFDNTGGAAGEKVMPDATAAGDEETVMPAAAASVDDESDDEADREVKLIPRLYSQTVLLDTLRSW